MTPAGSSGAIGLIQMSGDLDRAFGLLGMPPVEVGDCRLRRFGVIDRGLIARVSETHAFLTPHGGMAGMESVCRWLTERGVLAGRGESAGERFPEASSWMEAAMTEAVARAASPAAIELLLDQPRRWAEAGIPDPGPEAPAPDEQHSRRLRRLIDPPLVVGIGGANIGKSTFLNRLAGRSVAVVADEPGTTRDHVGAMVSLGVVVCRYVDMPGERDAPDPLETEARSIAAPLMAQADLVLRFGDAGCDPPEGPEGAASMVVALRSDLGEASFGADARVSAASGAGWETCVEAIGERLVPREARLSPLPWRFW